MALNIKDAETEQLAAELATRLKINKTAAIRHALRAQLALLESRQLDRLGDVMEVLRTEIWPLTAGSAPITKADREAILGYDDNGVSA
ncbi:type II toxin-antitoxin system VapB family antitoxin [Mycobacterium paragordonae]|uniref:type II toxin-antitoxin system VapB family antitoxin n=1 Tax=Mycobacterium paragordonae TaxID=1389713 RepID=UPI00105C2D4D|nr:type II toxin-antitoxin system VapB family antitoxin [Mycobacterium paragordonae]TDL02920.1 antitoxin VapB36 [Mycobacterium paragordonae]